MVARQDLTKNLYISNDMDNIMKKGMLILLVIILLCSTTVYAVSYGGQITRIQTFPGEVVKEQVDFAKESIADQNAQATQKLQDLENAVANLKSNIDKMSTDATNSRTETNVQLSNIVNSMNGLKTQLDEIRDLKNLKTELPALIDQSREIITPKILLNSAY